VTTDSAYDADGHRTASVSANHAGTTDTYDHLGRLVQTTAPAVALYNAPLATMPSVALNADGGSAGSFGADADYSGGNTYSSGAAIDTSGVVNPAPQAVYQTERYGNFSYTVPGLTPGGAYRVRLHFAEQNPSFPTGPGQRVFNVAINGAPVLTNFDIYAAAGGPDRAIVEEFTVNADSSGQLTIQYTSVVDNAKVSGIEVIPTTAIRETTSYDGDGNVVRTTDATGATTTSSYDPLGRQVNTTNPVSGTTVTTYTADELTATQDPQGNVTTPGYDAAGRPIQTTNPATGTMQTAYDAAGNAVAMTTTDRTNGTVVALQALGYDAQDRVITSTVVTNTANVAGSALTTLTRYDQDGNVAQTQQPTGDVVYNVYDAADRLTNVEIDPGPLTKTQAATHPSYEAYGYDQAGNQTVAMDADNRTTTTQYDGDNRAVQSVAVSYPPTGTTTITTTMQYDPDGNTLRQTTQTSDSTSPGQVQTHTVANAYNAADWDTSATDDGLTTNYGYDAAGQQRSETIVDGSTPVTMQLDAAVRVTSIGESYGGAGPYTSQYAYNADDLPTNVTLPGGVSEAPNYDANSALTSLNVSGPNTGVITTTLSTAYGYGYNAAGWTTSTSTISGSDAIAHDGAGRLTSDCGPQVEVRNTGDHCDRWTYDNNGNVTSQVADNGAPEVYAYNPTQPNEVTQATFQQANVPASDRYKNTDTYYGYDGNGDTTAITSPVNGAYTDTAAINDHLQYDAEQRPITITHLECGVPITIAFGYNADGLRARYTVVMSGTVVNDERFQYRDGELAQVSVVTATLNANGSIKSQGVPYTDTYITGGGAGGHGCMGSGSY